MIYLDAIILPAGLTWSDQWQTAAAQVATRRRLDGGQVIYPRALAEGRAITLTATADQPITVANANALAALAANPSGVYSLSMPLRGFSASVRFRWEDGDPLELALLIDYADPDATDPVIGTIRLATV